MTDCDFDQKLPYPVNSVRKKRRVTWESGSFHDANSRHGGHPDGVYSSSKMFSIATCRAIGARKNQKELSGFRAFRSTGTLHDATHVGMV